MKISYAICCCVEYQELSTLLTLLFKYLGKEDEIVVVVDQTNFNDEVIDICKKYQVDERFKWYFNSLNQNFAQHKNYLNGCCSEDSDFIFNLDPDELPNEFLLQNLKTILQSNPNIEAYWVPRINTVDGITKEYVKQMDWIQNNKGWINWPYDSQMRIYKNIERIEWVGHVHERLIGYKEFTKLPDEEEYAIYHHKSFERQKKQNEFYSKING